MRYGFDRSSKFVLPIAIWGKNISLIILGGHHTVKAFHYKTLEKNKKDGIIDAQMVLLISGMKE